LAGHGRPSPTTASRGQPWLALAAHGRAEMAMASHGWLGPLAVPLLATGEKNK